MISLFILGLLLLLISWNLYYATHWSKDLTVSLNFLQDYVYAGEQTQMTEQIENRKKLMLPVLEVSFHADKKLSFLDCENTNVSDFVYKRDIFALLGHQRITRKLALHCPKRGFYRINESWLTTFSLLHRRRFSVECPANAKIYVYAARTNVSDIVVACERLMGSIQCAKRLYEDPFAFSSIREYTVTDPMNTINWKASARTGELMVNTFESTLTEKVMIYLDLEDSAILKYEYLVEESVSIASSLAQKLIVRGMDVGICVNTDTTDPHAEKEIPDKANSELKKDKNLAENLHTILIEPAGGKKQLNKIERMLAKCRSENAIPFGTLLSAQSDIRRQLLQQSSFESSEDTVMIFISKNAERNQPAIEHFVGNRQQVIWVLPYTKNDICCIKTPDNIHLIKREVERN